MTVAMADDASELARLRRECELYRRLLALGQCEEPEPFLREALALVVEVTESRQGYLELYDDEQAGAARWSLAHGFAADQVEGVRAALSSGIIAESIASRTGVPNRLNRPLALPGAGASRRPATRC